MSPFGARKALSVHIEQSVFGLERVLVNGGRRGFLVEISPEAFRRLLSPVEVDVAIEP